ncbi:LptF/LptG family permease [Lutimonas saemankumensis]|uniref:LptF/LptG family permease n=1 Tax=Lutimonas saemankumensis TaxID=483016 RepID=UPI001CD2C8CC|nr:LptF/LptG family permease [Lutimonas saemankumensis]MCA0931122.1 LptF/LptG family permease [Lutimonas saemankumensis]
MKILNRYILKSFLAPFLATFFIILFVLIMQALWLQFDKIAGKGISMVIILKFLSYMSLMMVPTALPIAILLSSIMALGNMAENYEFAAVKSAGISLQRFIRPLVILMFFMSIANFLFLNYVFPYASLKSKNLIYNMKMKEPGLALVPGTFNTEIPNYSIKFDEKYGEEENFLKNVLIYDLRSNTVNNKVITAKKGEIVSEEGSRYLTLVLEDGYYAEDMIGNKTTVESRKRAPFTKAHFDHYEVNIDVSNIGDFDPDEVRYKTGKEMLSLKQLDFFVDSLQTPYRDFVINRASRVYTTLKVNNLVKDSLGGKTLKPEILDNFNERNRRVIAKNASTTVLGNLENLRNFKNTLKDKTKIINGYNVEFHKRIAFSVACLVLFFVGTPLGSIIRKGGFGLPMIIAVTIFVIYFFISTFGKNMAESNRVTPFIGGWMATFILLPFGVLLMIRATNDKGLFNLDAFLQPVTTVFNKLFKLNKK